MKIVRVTYTTKAEYAGQNAANIKKVMADLREINNPSIRYFACLSADGKTFAHNAFFDSADAEKVLLELPSFKSFQEALKQSGPETPPKNEALTLVDACYDIF